MKYIILLLKGFVIGIAKIMPGVSGAVLSISFGIYEKILYIISHPLKLKKEDLLFLFFLLLGASIGIILLCDIIKWCLNKHFFLTISIFIGLIVGGLPEITNEIKKITIFDIILFIISFILIIFIINLSSGNTSSNNNYFLMGSMESLTTIIPGISGTAIFMALGWYQSLLTTIKSILTFKCPLITSLTFISGFIISTFVISWIITKTFEKHKKKSYICILGFMVASLFEMITSIKNYDNLLLGFILFFTGYYITYKLNNVFSKY